MPAWWRRESRIKYPELNKFYHEYTNYNKTSYVNFLWRVIKWWESFDTAILRWWRIKKPNMIKTKVQSDWRECTICKEFKLWSEYHKNKVWVLWYTSDCKECRNNRKKQYRSKTNYSKDKEYKAKRRTLIEWEIIVFREPVMFEWNPREDKYTVLGYEYGKWYILQSHLTKNKIYMSSADNHSRKWSCRKFYRLWFEKKQDTVIEKQENKDFYGVCM